MHMDERNNIPRETLIEALWLQFQAVFLGVLHASGVIPKDNIAAATLLEAYHHDFMQRVASIREPLPLPSPATMRDREVSRMYALMTSYGKEFDDE